MTKKLQKIEYLAYRSAYGFGVLVWHGIYLIHHVVNFPIAVFLCYINMVLWYVGEMWSAVRMCNVFTFAVKQTKAYTQMNVNFWSRCLVSECDVFMTYRDVPALPLSFFFFLISISRGSVYPRFVTKWLNRLVELWPMTQTHLALISRRDSFRACQYNGSLFSTRTRHTKNKWRSGWGGGVVSGAV